MEGRSIPTRTFSQHTLRQTRERRAAATLRIAKVIIIGDPAVGKTSLVMRYAHDVFDTDYKATIGVDFEVEKFEILGLPFTLQMWDTAGSERFQCIASSYYRGANAVIICFDYSKIQSLNTVRKWLDNAIAENPTQEFLLFLVGTKRELVSDAIARQIDADAVKVAESMNAEYWPVSAKRGDNVEELFARVGTLTFDMILTKEVNSESRRESKVIADIGPRKISLDADFERKTRDNPTCPGKLSQCSE
jgi:small GTP-binding protein